MSIISGKIIELQEIKGYFYNTQFILLDSLVFKPSPFYFEHSNFVEYNINKFFIKCYDALDINNHQFSGAVYDKTGNLLDFISIKTDVENIYLFYYDEIRKKIIITESGYIKNPLKSYISFYTSAGDGTYNLSSTLYITDSLRSGGIFHMLFLPGEQVLCYLSEATLYTNSNLYLQDPNARAQSLILFNATDIGLSTVSVKEPFSDIADVVLFPNPAGEEITVQFPDKVSGHGQILDSQGHMHESFDIENVTEWKIPCSGLSPGLYFFRFYDKLGQSVVRRFVRM